MKKGKVFFHPIDGFGVLTISWSSMPKGDAIEAKKGSGVGFFSSQGTLLCVIFDEVCALQDQQTLEFAHQKVSVNVKEGHVTYTMSKKNANPSKGKKKVRKKQSF